MRGFLCALKISVPTMCTYVRTRIICSSVTIGNTLGNGITVQSCHGFWISGELQANMSFVKCLIVFGQNRKKFSLTDRAKGWTNCSHLWSSLLKEPVEEMSEYTLKKGQGMNKIVKEIVQWFGWTLFSTISFDLTSLSSGQKRWMNEYGAMVECYWQGKTEVLGEKYYTAWVVDGWMSIEQWWNDTDRGKLK